MLSHEMKNQLRGFLEADLGRSDLTAHIVPGKKVSAQIIVREKCVLAGLEEAAYLFGLKGVKCIKRHKDGEKVRVGAVVLKLSGLNKAVFGVERTALNIISRMSAVATACSDAQKIAGERISVSLTRKTMPGFNLFDNKAAEVAGIWTHRIDLNSFVLLKENNVALFDKPCDAVLEARAVYGNKMIIEIETESVAEALNAITAKPDIVMLDNFSAATAKSAIKKLRARGFAGRIELSGGITLKNLKRFAQCKPDLISMGSLTQSVSSKNFSLDIL